MQMRRMLARASLERERQRGIVTHTTMSTVPSGFGHQGINERRDTGTNAIVTLD
jgi:hypothetical protein